MKMNFSIRIGAGIGNAIEDIQMYRSPTQWKHSSAVQIFYGKYYYVCAGEQSGYNSHAFPFRDFKELFCFLRLIVK